MTKQGFNMKKGLLIVAIFIGSLLPLSIGRADEAAVKMGNPANPANTSVAVAVSQGSARNALEDKFRMALIEEETGQQLDTAIQAYKEVIAGLDDQRKMAVTAIFHLGECYRKQGKTNEAVAQFERILRDFSEQNVVVALAQRRCGELAPGKSGKVADQGFGLAISTDAMTTEEADEIHEIKLNIKDSPDLINEKDKLGNTPLLKAAASGHLVAVKFLIANSADVNARDKLSRNALHVASENGHKSVVEFLLSQGVDVNSKDLGEATPLILAVEKGFKSVVRVLIDAKADVNAYGIVNKREDPVRHTDPRYTPLFYSIRNGNLDIMRLLLANKADPNATNTYGETPIRLAINSSFNTEDVSIKAIELLLQYKADLNLKSESVMSGVPGTPLHMAVLYSTKMADFLILHGADVNAINVRGDTPMHLAVWENQRMNSVVGPRSTKDAVELLLNHGAKINAQNNNGDTPLHIAVRNNHISLVELLLSRNADCNITNRQGKTPFMLTKEVKDTQKLSRTPSTKASPELEALLHKYGVTDTPKKSD